MRERDRRAHKADGLAHLDGLWVGRCWDTTSPSLWSPEHVMSSIALSSQTSTNLVPVERVCKSPDTETATVKVRRTRLPGGGGATDVEQQTDDLSVCVYAQTFRDETANVRRQLCGSPTRSPG